MKKMCLVLLMVLAILSTTVVAYADTDSIKSTADSGIMVYGPLNSYAEPGNAAWGTAPVPAVATWKHPSWPLISGSDAIWISNTTLISGNISGDTWRLFRKTVELCTGAYNISGTINANSDNAEAVYVNGVLVGSDGNLQGTPTNDLEWKTVKPYNYNASDASLKFEFIVRNYAGASDPYSNPTGVIFNATINYSCPVEVTIDIKPGSDPSCFNNNGHGIIPVAILGSATFDVNNINVTTITLQGLPVAVRGNKSLASYSDFNSDGFTDLVVKFEDLDGTFSKGDGFATLNGNLKDGTPFFGVGDICVTQ